MKVDGVSPSSAVKKHCLVVGLTLALDYKVH